MDGSLRSAHWARTDTPSPLAVAPSAVNFEAQACASISAALPIPLRCTKLAVKKPMPADERRAFTAPYDSWANRIATLRFVQDIPLGAGDPAWNTVAEIGRRLPEFADRPALLLWGMQDFVFDHTCLREFRRALPQAQAREYANAGHYVLEDARAEVLAEVQAFLRAHPVGA